MFNVNQITAQLAKLPDQALQQYAAMHKNDPYTVALALAESNRRKQIRSSAQGPQGEMPKVVDQEVAQMAAPELPEDTGIAQLPAENIKGMATGGIVAFEEGGEVPRYQNTGLVQLPSSEFTGVPIYSQGAFGPQAGDAELQARIARIEANPRMSRADKDMLIGQARAQFGVPAVSTIPPTTPVPMGAKPTVTPAPTTLAPTTTQTSPRVENNNVVDKALEQKRKEDEAAAAGKKLPPEPGLPSLNAAIKQYEGTVYKNAPDKETLQKEFAAIDKPYVDKMQASIDKEAKRLSSDKEQDFYMALIQGGLAAAAGDSPNALQNIAKGFSTGAASYKEALKDFRKATQENTKAEAELARFQASGNKEALKSYYDQVAKRDDRFAQGVAGIVQQNMASSAALGAAKMNRDAMGDYRNASQVENIRKNIDAKLGDDPKYKFDAAKRAAEVERRLQIELQRYPNLAQYGVLPTKGDASGVSTQGWGQATVIQPQR